MAHYQLVQSVDGSLYPDLFLKFKLNGRAVVDGSNIIIAIAQGDRPPAILVRSMMSTVSLHDIIGGALVEYLQRTSKA